MSKRINVNKNSMVCLWTIWAEILIQHPKAMHFRCSNSNNNLLRNSSSNNKTHFILKPEKVSLLLMSKPICRQTGLIIPCMPVISKIDRTKLRCHVNFQMQVWKFWTITNNLFKVNNKEVHQAKAIVITKGSIRIRMETCSSNNFHQDLTWCHLQLVNNLTTLIDLRIQLPTFWVSLMINQIRAKLMVREEVNHQTTAAWHLMIIKWSNSTPKLQQPNQT